MNLLESFKKNIILNNDYTVEEKQSLFEDFCQTLYNNKANLYFINQEEDFNNITNYRNKIISEFLKNPKQTIELKINYFNTFSQHLNPNQIIHLSQSIKFLENINEKDLNKIYVTHSFLMNNLNVLDKNKILNKINIFNYISPEDLDILNKDDDQLKLFSNLIEKTTDTEFIKTVIKIIKSTTIYSEKRYQNIKELQFFCQEKLFNKILEEKNTHYCLYELKEVLFEKDLIDFCNKKTNEITVDNIIYPIHLLVFDIPLNLKEKLTKKLNLEDIFSYMKYNKIDINNSFLKFSNFTNFEILLKMSSSLYDNKLNILNENKIVLLSLINWSDLLNEKTSSNIMLKSFIDEYFKDEKSIAYIEKQKLQYEINSNNISKKQFKI